MEVESSTYTDFISSDRAGRRNAVYDIQQEATTISMRKLTGDIGNLSVEGPGELLHTPVSPVPGVEGQGTKWQRSRLVHPWEHHRCSGGTSHSLLQSAPSCLVGAQRVGDSPG